MPAATAAAAPVSAASTEVRAADGLSKRFGGIQALQNVSVTVREGEVLGLVGENGAGKSTLLSVLSGSLSPDGGQLRLRGEDLELRTYVEANLRGIFRAHQDQGLLANLSVADNVFLGHERKFTRFGMLQRRKMAKLADEYLERELPGRATGRSKVGDLPLDVRQMVEILRAFAVADLLGAGAPVILLDETTASLNHDEVQDLYRYIRARKGRATFVFVSHRLQEVLDLSDRIYVMKDGAVVDELNPRDADEHTLHAAMVGRVREELYYKEDLRRTEFGRPALEVRSLSAEPHFRDVSFAVRSGEIVAMGGVTGSGKTELARTLAGDLRATSGEIVVDNVALRLNGTRDRLGKLGYGPLDRQRDGVCLHQPIRLNVTLSCLDKLTRGVFLSRSAEVKLAKEAMGRYAIVAPDEEAKVSSLSGGNQQKVMLARLAGSECDVLVLDNPTRGVDAGARQEIYLYLRQLAQQGVGILLITDDLHELIGVANRIILMKDGRVVRVHEDPQAQQITEDQVVAEMV
ncbi:MAG: sugar ABC transporter ATP-binding protein [Solirubrobacteraceae bacterium]